IAGALGALCRWGIGQLRPGTPIGTLAVNLAGCFLLGLVMEYSERAQWMSHEWRAIITVGFIGTLTTFSTWSYETFHLARRGDMLLAASNFAVNVFFGFVLL